MTNEEIIEYLEYSPELRELVTDIINLKNGGQQFSHILDFCGISEEQARKIDSAYPCDYAKAIREIYPDFNNGYHCFDYNAATFGAMRNLKNDIANRILKQF
jgi:hypothetical protein